ncbi:MAG TPA: geranyl transferase [Planctomycetaceae bacterium]|nr:geranyl transferase [Planctomycetaceae bacterium]
MREPYLVELAGRVREGLTKLPDSFRAKHRDFVLAHQEPSGGFRGREGDADLYYTSFALRALAAMDELPDAVGRRAADFVRSRDRQSLDTVDLLNWLSAALILQSSVGGDWFVGDGSDWAGQIAERLEATVTPDGGYGTRESASLGSTYHSFLVMTIYELLGRSVPDPEGLEQFLASRQREDGGFVEFAPMRRGGTNPTAAAAVVLSRLERMRPPYRDGICRFFSQVSCPTGGFRANTRVPFGDGLSTFAVLSAAIEIGIGDTVDWAGIESFVRRRLERPEGGFRAAAWDEDADVEYTFYGLGCLALAEWSRRGLRQ